MSEGYDTFEFVRGQTDCREGVPHQSGQSESYDAGYSCEYQLEQNNANMGMTYGSKKAIRAA